MRLFRNSVHGVLVLAAMAVALAPSAVFADRDHARSHHGDLYDGDRASVCRQDDCACQIDCRGGTAVVVPGYREHFKAGSAVPDGEKVQRQWSTASRRSRELSR